MQVETPVIDETKNQPPPWNSIEVVAEVHSPEVPASLAPQVDDSAVGEDGVIGEDTDSSEDATFMEEFFKREHLDDDSDEVAHSEEEAIDVNASILKPGQLMTLTVNVGGREWVAPIDSGSTLSLGEV